MILALAVVLGLAASLARHRGRTFDRIAAIPLRSAWLALLAVGLQLPLLRAPMVPTGSIGLQMALFVTSLVLLLAFVWRNRRLVGVLILGVGVICNLVVIVANGGFMPITPETLVEINPGSNVEQWPEGVHYGNSKDVIRMREDTKLRVLSDVLVSPPPLPGTVAFSVGDLLIAAGIVVLLQGSRTQASVVKEPRPSHSWGGDSVVSATQLARTPSLAKKQITSGIDTGQEES
jgi:hypothetical protein